VSTICCFLIQPEYVIKHVLLVAFDVDLQVGECRDFGSSGSMHDVGFHFAFVIDGAGPKHACDYAANTDLVNQAQEKPYRPVTQYKPTVWFDGTGDVL